MRFVLLVPFYFIRSWLVYVFTGQPKTELQYYSFNLFNSTFRIPQSERNSPVLVLRKYADAIRTLFFKRKSENAGVVLHAENNGSFVYEVFREEYALRKTYTEFFTSQPLNGGILKEELYFSPSVGAAILLFFILSAWLPFLFLHSLFKKDKAPLALLFKEIIENINLLQLSDKHKIKTLFFFCIFEVDANMATKLLQKNGVFVSKIPSEVPLGLWNQVIIADKLCICNGYQLDELKHFKRSMFIKETEFWGPEQVMNNIEIYSKPVKRHDKTIGFYSTGAWVRKLENHMEQNFDAEEYVKTSLRKFCLKNPEVSLIIYLHPRERWEKYYAEALKMYDEIYNGINYEIAAKEIPTSLCFEKTNIAVALNSTVIYERLYYGFKTVLMPIGFSNFPIEGSNMKNICVYKEEDLVAKLETELPWSNTEFFDHNGIRHFAKYLFN